LAHLVEPMKTPDRLQTETAFGSSGGGSCKRKEGKKARGLGQWQEPGFSARVVRGAGHLLRDRGGLGTVSPAEKREK